MINFEQFKKMMFSKLDTDTCIEILFVVSGNEKYDNCWMGKIHSKTDVYWYGLTADGTNAFEYEEFENFATNKVFDGKSLVEVWEDVEILEIDGCDPMERIKYYSE